VKIGLHLPKLWAMEYPFVFHETRCIVVYWHVYQYFVGFARLIH